MRIAHIVTYISSDGAFGGPVRVALGHAEALARQGHEVIVFAGSDQDRPADAVIDGYRIRTFPARRLHRRLGFAGMYAPGLTRALRQSLPEMDVVHVHLARDLVTLPAVRAARKSGIRYVVQPHGMIDRSGNPLAGPIDAWEVRSAIRDAAAVLTLTEREVDDVREIAPGAHCVPIENGVRPVDTAPYGERSGGVIFLARLHPRKRPLAFVEMALELLQRGVDERFTLIGPDEGEGGAVERMIGSAGAEGRISWIGGVSPAETDGLMRAARVYVLPSVGEVFPMSLLEAFNAGTPSVVTSSLGIASRCEAYGAAVVTDGAVSSLADAVHRILQDPSEARRLREGAQSFVQSELSIDAVVDRLLAIYRGRPEGRTPR